MWVIAMRAELTPSLRAWATNDDSRHCRISARRTRVSEGQCVTATAMARENGLPIYVFNMDQYGNLEKVINGEQIGTLVKL